MCIHLGSQAQRLIWHLLMPATTEGGGADAALLCVDGGAGDGTEE
jgi:hypothetical protein